MVEYKKKPSVKKGELIKPVIAKFQRDKRPMESLKSILDECVEYDPDTDVEIDLVNWSPQDEIDYRDVAVSIPKNYPEAMLKNPSVRSLLNRPVIHETIVEVEDEKGFPETRHYIYLPYQKGDEKIRRKR